MLRRPREWVAAAFVILHFAFAISSSAHPADNSQARFKVEPQRVEFRLTFNLYTLQQFHLLDTNEDGKITRQELDVAETALRDYLREHVLVTINEEDADLGTPSRMERMWPEQSAGGDVMAADYGQRFVDFSFVKTTEQTIEKLWIGFNIFKETGELHMVQAAFEQDGKPEEVSFSRNEPEYLWETDFEEIEKPVAETVVASDVEAVPKSRGIHPAVLVIGLIAIGGTWMLLRKVNKISRGGFRIGPPPE